MDKLLVDLEVEQIADWLHELIKRVDIAEPADDRSRVEWNGILLSARDLHAAILKKL